MLAGVHHEREGHLCLGEFNSSTYFFDTEAPGQLIDVIVAALRELSLMKFAHIGCMDCTKPPPWVWHTVHQGRGPLVDFLDFVSEAAMQREHERIEQMNRRINKGQ